MLKKLRAKKFTISIVERTQLVLALDLITAWYATFIVAVFASMDPYSLTQFRYVNIAILQGFTLGLMFAVLVRVNAEVWKAGGFKALSQAWKLKRKTNKTDVTIH